MLYGNLDRVVNKRGKAHSCYFSTGIFEKLTGDNKELLLIPDAIHTGLYDGGGKDAIPFGRLENFSRANLH